MSIEQMNRQKSLEVQVKELTERVQKLEIDIMYLEKKDVLKRPGRPRKEAQLDA